MTADEKYEAAMTASGELLDRINGELESKDPAIGLIGDILAQRHNAPFMATIYEATQEVASGVKQRPDDH